MKIMLIVAFVFALTISTFAQIKITPNKVTYKRAEGKSFEITYPKVTGKGPIAEIEKTISYWNNYETNLVEETENGWLEEATYKINYNNKGILDIELTFSGSAAYPDSHVKTLVVDLESGKRIKLKDAFRNRTDLYNKLAQAQEKEIKMALSEVKKGDDEDSVNLADLINESKEYYSIYEIEEFTVSDKGVTFLFNYGFVHAVQALEPEGRYFFTWAELKPFVAEYGPLGTFLPKSSI